MTQQEFAAIMQKLDEEEAAREQRWSEWHRQCTEERAQREQYWAERDRHCTAQQVADKAERERQWTITLREFRLGRHTIEEALAILAQMTRQLVENTDETRAQTQALLKVIDRMDRFDGGTAAA
jgi:hypothetical protein